MWAKVKSASEEADDSSKSVGLFSRAAVRSELAMHRWLPQWDYPGISFTAMFVVGFAYLAIDDVSGFNGLSFVGGLLLFVAGLIGSILSLFRIWLPWIGLYCGGLFYCLINIGADPFYLIGAYFFFQMSLCALLASYLTHRLALALGLQAK